MSETDPNTASEANDIDPALVEAMRARVVKRKPQDYSKRKAGPGRPKGHPKTGGKKAGTPNLMSPEFREWLMERARPFELLASICAGEEIEDKDGKRKPTMQERMRAAETITRKLLPDLAATALTGKDGGPIESVHRTGLPDERQETARVLGFLFREWQERIKDAEADMPVALPAKPAPAQVTYSQPSVIAALPAPSEAPPEEPAGPQVGHVEQVGGMTIQLVQKFPDGREWWSIRDAAGKMAGSVFGRDQAEAKAKQMSEAE